MRRLGVLGLMIVLGMWPLAAMAANESFQNVALVDVNCSKKAASNPDAHTRECALKCSASGFGIVTTDSKFLKLDAAGNAQVVDALKASDKKDHLRVDVKGNVEGDTLKVSSIKLL
jgi:hypothetical protein